MNLVVVLIISMILIYTIFQAPRLLVLFFILTTPILDKFSLTASTNLFSLNLYENYDPDSLTFWALINLIIMPFIVIKLVTLRKQWGKMLGGNIFLLLILWMVVSILWSIDPSMSMRKIFNPIIFFIFAVWASIFFPSKEDRTLLINTIIVSGLLYLPYYYLQFVLGEGGMLDGAGLMRARGAMIHSNAGSFFLLLPALSVFLVKIQHQTRSTTRMLWTVVFSLLSIAIVICYSRANIGLLFVCVIVGVLLNSDKNRSRNKKIIIVIALLGTLILIVSQFLFVRLESESLTTLENRTNIWDVVYNYIINGDIIKGNGFGSLSELSKIDEFLGIPHSYYLQTILETGMVGVVIVVWLFLRTMSLQWKNIADCADDVTAKNMTMICFFAASLMFLNSFTEVIISSMNAAFTYWVLFALPTVKHDDQTR